MRHIDGAERRRRLLVRHHLATPAATIEDVAGDVVGLHSTDPASVVLSARARLDPFAVGDLEAALYERRTLLRLLAMRRTMFVAPTDLAAVMNASCTRALVPGEQQRLAAMLVEAGVTDDPDGWIERRRGRHRCRTAGGRRAAAGEHVVDARPRARAAAAGRGRQALRGHGRRVHAHPVPRRREGADRPRPAARVMAVDAVPVGADGRVDRPPARPRRPLGPRRSRRSLAALVRTGHRRRPRVVGEVDQA